MNERLLRRAAEATGRSLDDVRNLLEAEQRSPGSMVAAEIKRRGIEPFVWSDKLIDFYKESDAFVFELLPWNEASFKQSMRRWSRSFLLREADRLGRPLQIICHGDGLGLDAAAFAEDRHEVTYFEYPGPSERFARLTFAEEGRDIDVVTDAESLPRGVDVVTSFDVLEHVPDPRATVRELVHLLRRPGGLLLVHAPFYLIHRRYPTHLTSNRRHAGSTRLYEREGLRLIDGNIAWNPLALRLEGDAGRADPLTMLRLKLLKQALKLGRHTTLPFVPFQRWARRSKLSSTR